MTEAGVDLIAGLAQASKDARAWACNDCGKCTARCPLARSGAGFSPRRHILAANLGQPHEVVRGDAFRCLACGLCDERCPTEVDFVRLVLRLRELTYTAGVEPECPHGGALLSAMRLMARGGTQQDRMGWLSAGLRSEPVTGDVFLWTGCTMYYDAFFPGKGGGLLEGTRAALRLLNHLGVTPVVSPEERCCGHDLLWNGDRASFAALAEHNVELVTASGATTLVIPCAECYRTWRLDYAPYLTGSPPRILHLSEYLAEHMDRLLPRAPIPRRVTFQDPCRLGRHLAIYHPPRQLLAAVHGIEIAEMRHSGESAVCCAGGAWSSCDHFVKQIQVDRLREARKTGAEVLVTACPKCRIHLSCAMKDPHLAAEIVIPMKDLAEILVEALM